MSCVVPQSMSTVRVVLLAGRGEMLSTVLCPLPAPQRLRKSLRCQTCLYFFVDPYVTKSGSLGSVTSA